MRKDVLVTTVLGLGLVFLFLADGEILQRNSADSSQFGSGPPIESLSANSDDLEASDIPVSPPETQVAKIEEIVQSVEYADRDVRDAVVLAVEKEMAQRRQTYPNGWIRWQPVLIDQNDLTNGNYLDEDTVVSEFLVSPFQGETYRATRTLYRTREATASATWDGILDDGSSGSIKISVIETENGAELRLRLRTPHGQFTIMPTELYGAYVSAETDEAFWSTQIVTN